MGTITAQTIINRAAALLEDAGNTSFKRPELLDWLNEAQTQVVAFVPGANSKAASLQLTAGTKQTLPTESIVLIEAVRNTGGPTVRLATRESLDGGPIDWHTAAEKDVVKNYVYDVNVPDIFYVYPPNTGNGYLDVVYAVTPTVLASENSAISVKDVYAAALLNYVMFRAHSHDTDYLSGGKEAAAAYYGLFKECLSGRANMDVSVGANNALAPLNPANQGSTK